MIVRENRRILSLPVRIKHTLYKIAALFTGWLLVYNYWLKPLGIPDTQLTAIVTWGTERLLSIFYTDIHSQASSIYIHGSRVINIASPCNGLELIALYIGILICMPGNWKKLLIYSVTGILSITFLNMVRCTLLAWMYYRHMDLADFAHHYAFKLAIYAFVFFGWYLYSRNMNHHESKA